MSQSTIKLAIELEREARLMLTATRLDVCQAIKCKNWYKGNCQFKTIFIMPGGGCGDYELKPDKDLKDASG